MPPFARFIYFIHVICTIFLVDLLPMIVYCLTINNLSLLLSIMTLKYTSIKHAGIRQRPIIDSNQLLCIWSTCMHKEFAVTCHNFHLSVLAWDLSPNVYWYRKLDLHLIYVGYPENAEIITLFYRTFSVPNWHCVVKFPQMFEINGSLTHWCYVS